MKAPSRSPGPDWRRWICRPVSFACCAASCCTQASWCPSPGSWSTCTITKPSGNPTSSRCRSIICAARSAATPSRPAAVRATCWSGGRREFHQPPPGWRTALVLLLTVTLVGQGAVWVFDRALRDYLSSDLQREADALLAAVSNGPQGLYLDTGRVSPDYMRLYSGRYFIVEAGPHRWRSRSLWDQRLPMPLDSADHTLQPGPSGQQLLVRSERFNKLGQSVQISVALDYQPLLEAFARARVWLWGLGGLAVLISLAVQQLLLRKA